MSFQMRVSSTSGSKPLRVVNNKVFYTRGLGGERSAVRTMGDSLEVTRTLPNDGSYDRIRQSNTTTTVNVLPDGTPILEASPLPCTWHLAIGIPLASIDPTPVDPRLRNLEAPTIIEMNEILSVPGRELAVSSKYRSGTPVFLPALHAGASQDAFDPARRPPNLSPLELKRIKGIEGYSLEPGNYECVLCNLRLNRLALMSGFGPILTSEGAKPLLYPFVSTTVQFQSPTVGIMANGTEEPVSYLDQNVQVQLDRVRERTNRSIGIDKRVGKTRRAAKKNPGLAKLLNDEIHRYSVKATSVPPPIPRHSIVYESSPGTTCSNPMAVGFSNGNLVERGMTVTDTNVVANYALTTAFVKPPLDAPRSSHIPT